MVEIKIFQMTGGAMQSRPLTRRQCIYEVYSSKNLQLNYMVSIYRSYLTGMGCIPQTDASRSLAYLVTFLSLFNWSVYPVLLLLVLTILLALRMAQIAREHKKLSLSQADPLNMSQLNGGKHSLSAVSSTTRFQAPHQMLELNSLVHSGAGTLNQIKRSESSSVFSYSHYRTESGPKRKKISVCTATVLTSRYQSDPNWLSARSPNKTISDSIKYKEPNMEAQEFLISAPIFTLGEEDDPEAQVNQDKPSNSNIHEETNNSTRLLSPQKINNRPIGKSIKKRCLLT